MDKKNIIVISIIIIAVIIAAILLFIVNPFSAEPPAVQQETFRIPAQPAETQEVPTSEQEEAKPVEKKTTLIKDTKTRFDFYVVKEGETLESIADKLYGDSKKWFKIFAANESEIDWYDTIYVGQKLKIPPPETN